MPLDDEARSRAVRIARLKYQKGLLRFLQNKDAMTGLMQMHEAVSNVERLAPGPAQYHLLVDGGGPDGGDAARGRADGLLAETSVWAHRHADASI
jgi:hypothetical protein